MRVVPWWALASAVAAPVFLIGGWTLGAGRQPDGFDPTSDTISALAARDATDPWIMTLGLVGLGICHCVTAAGLRSLARAGRLLLALGGLATIGVALFPLPADGGTSLPHTLTAALAFGLLALWPALAPPPGRPGDRAPWVASAVLLLALVGWFTVELVGGGDRIGFTERVAAGAEALWPLLVAGWLRLRRPDPPLPAAAG